MPHLVATLADLKALTIRPTLVTTLGYYAAGDGGGGPPWLWVDASTATPDDFLTAQCTVGPAGRYIRQLPNGATVSAKWGGAGLGQANDNAKFQTLLSAPGAHAVDISGCTIPLTGVSVGASASCPGIFSDGSGSITCASGTTSATFLVSVYKSDFYVDRVFFDAPVSTNPAAAPACGTVLAFEGPGAQADRLRVTNCRFSGGSAACQFRNVDGSMSVWFTGNEVASTWGLAASFAVPREAIITGNKFRLCGYDAASASGVVVISTNYSTVPAENVLFADNIISNCQIGFNQEAVDFFGNLIRNLVVADNIIDGVTYGGFEFKTDDSAASPDFYGDVSITGNLINFKTGGGIGVALNGFPLSTSKQRRWKISGNHFVGDGAGSTATGVAVGGYDNVDISGNTFTNIAAGVLVTADGGASNTATEISIFGNKMNVTGAGIAASSGRTVTGLQIVGNAVISTGASPLNLAGMTANELTCKGNHFETKATATYGVVLCNVQKGRFDGNTVVGQHVGVRVDGTASTNLRIFRNDIECVYYAIDVNTGAGVDVFENSTVNDAAYPIVGGVGTYRSWYNKRAPSATIPSSVAGTAGDIVPSLAPDAGALGWVCKVAGGPGAASWVMI